MKLKLIVNPAAGRGRARRRFSEAVRYLANHGADVDCEESRDREHLVEIARTSRGYDRIVACGGDGTVHLTVRGLDFDHDVLGVLPLGSGDDVAKTLGIPHDLRRACDVVLGGTTRMIDVAMANSIRYCGVAGLGFDSRVNRYANENSRFLRGSLIYLYSVFCVLEHFTPERVRIEIDGRSEEREIMFAAVGNTHRYGGGIQIVPTAKFDDRSLDACIVGKCGKWDLVKTLPLAYTGGHVRRDFVRLERGSSFHFSSEQPLEVFADGEYVTSTPVTMRLDEKQLAVAVPAVKE